MKDLGVKFNLVKESPVKTQALTTWVFLCLFIGISSQAPGYSFTQDRIGYASWYSIESCKKEGTSGIMANGEVFNDKEMVCASWDYPFETRLKITSLANAKAVIAVVKDRGPARRLVKKGRIIDLSKGAFSKITDLKQGVIQVKIEVIK
jgi:rare lipoprotein A